jgi:hypothetical protein
MKLNPIRYPSKSAAPTLTTTRDPKMGRSAHAYVRDNTIQFYEWLDALGLGALPEFAP